ncbi:MAG: hypothetical protein KatS3mg068_0362 [Candidatus Sericytochromatia bacterium]|nr:MAG: hypothetical protein KatS3mg068_0362 [Candidatus Sericytochromatia bacterium]
MEIFLKINGLNDGKKIGYILESILLAKLNSKISTLEEEKDLAIKLIRNY